MDTRQPGKFGVNLMQVMNDQGLTGLQLSYVAMVAPARISDLLRGKTLDPRISTAKSLADALGVSVDSLIR